jgi:hypothetical protein
MISGADAYRLRITRSSAVFGRLGLDRVGQLAWQSISPGIEGSDDPRNIPKRDVKQVNQKPVSHTLSART